MMTCSNANTVVSTASPSKETPPTIKRSKESASLFLYLGFMRRIVVHILLLICGLALAGKGIAQSTQTISYTIAEGLPSNSVYKTVIDRYGYLWIATENGLARFDGRSFKIYTTAQGLPDNEITDLFIDSSQTLWVMPFRKTISYYNAQRDRFENDETDPELMKIEQGNVIRGCVLQYGGVAFCNNERNFFIYKEGKVTAYKNFLDPFKSARPDRVIEYAPDKYLLVCNDSLRKIQGGRIVQSTYLGIPGIYTEYFQHTLYTISGNQMKKFRISSDGDAQLIVARDFPFAIRIFCRAGKDLVVTSVNGTTYPVDTVTLELKDPLLYKIPVRNVLEDRNGSSWISSSDRGLIKIQQKRISSFTAIPELLQGFNAILVYGKKILAGNIYGEVLVYDGVYDVKKLSLSGEKNVDGIVRRLVEMKNSIYVACQTGSFEIDKKTLQLIRPSTPWINRSSKTAVAVNDSVILLGNHAVAFRYDLLHRQVLDTVLKRVTALGIAKNKTVYLGSNEGLYRWDKDSLYYFGKTQKVLTYRISAIAGTDDNLLWVGLGSDSLVVLYQDQLVASIPLGNTIPGNVCKSLFSNKPGEIWLGTNKGLNKIQYRFSPGNFSYNNTFFSSADGLIGQQVNDITEHHDTLYVATDGGINYLPVNLHLPVTDIATFITKVAINGKDTLVQAAYSLPYDKTDIGIEFSGIDLTGYYPLFEYRINGGNWVQTNRNSIELRLSPGKTNIQIRALKRDGKASSEMAGIEIFIETPFWKNSLFWTLMGFFLFVVIIFVLQYRNRERRKKEVETVLTEKKLSELEMQALKAQINPHFVFNCLNSIKGFIFEKDFKQADKYLDKFSELLRSTLDNSSSSIISLKDEIQYLDNYLQMEKLRFDDKFDYFVHVEKEMDLKNIFVPSMLLQPYVENAVRHGIRHLVNRKGLIQISVSKTPDWLICAIDDNGVGREKATAVRNELHTEYQSRGMQLSKRRAELYGIEQEIIDKKDATGNATGTTIVLEIPLTLKPQTD